MRLEDFEGAWSVRRRIVHDGAGPRHGSAHGSGAADGDGPSRGPGPSTRRSAERGGGGRPAGGAMPSAPGPERIAGRSPLRGGSAALRRAMPACADRAGATVPPGPDPARPAGGGDGTPGWEASFEGRATLTPDGEGLVWREEGTLTLPGRPPLAAGRRYLWRPAAGGHRGALRGRPPVPPHRPGPAAAERPPPLRRGPLPGGLRPATLAALERRLARGRPAPRLRLDLAPRAACGGRGDRASPPRCLGGAP